MIFSLVTNRGFFHAVYGKLIFALALLAGYRGFHVLVLEHWWACGTVRVGRFNIQAWLVYSVKLDAAAKANAIGPVAMLLAELAEPGIEIADFVYDLARGAHHDTGHAREDLDPVAPAPADNPAMSRAFPKIRECEKADAKVIVRLAVKRGEVAHDVKVIVAQQQIVSIRIVKKPFDGPVRVTGHAQVLLADKGRDPRCPFMLVGHQLVPATACPTRQKFSRLVALSAILKDADRRFAVSLDTNQHGAKGVEAAVGDDGDG